jgi:MFS transporter, DHA1 family, multidrug resistance protein
MIAIHTKLTLLIIVSAACLASSIIVPTIPSISTYYAMELNQSSMLIGIYLCGYLLGQIIFSFLSKRTSPKLALQIGFILFVIGSVIQLCSFDNKAIGLLFLGRFTSALGASSGLICVFAIINDKFSVDESKKLLSLAFISLASFSYLSIMLSGIITSYFGWKAIFYTILIISILYFYLICLNIPSFKLTSFKNNKNKYSTILNYFYSLKNSKLILASMIVAFTTTTTYLYNSTAAMISTNYFHFSANYFGICSLLNFIGLISGGYLSSILIKKFCPIKVISFGMFIVGIPLILFVFFTNIIINNDNYMILFFVLTAILNIGLGIIYPSGSYLALNSLECSTTASSIMNFIKIACPAVVIGITSFRGMWSNGTANRLKELSGTKINLLTV